MRTLKIKSRNAFADAARYFVRESARDARQIFGGNTRAGVFAVPAEQCDFVADFDALVMGFAVFESFQPGSGSRPGKGALVPIVAAVVFFTMLAHAWRIRQRMGRAAETIVASLSRAGQELARAA